MTDNRFNVPSASSMRRTSNCPGWLKYANGLESEAGEDAVSGTRIALALEHGPNSEQWDALTPQEQHTASLCWSQTMTVLFKWAYPDEMDECADTGESVWNEAHKEKRLGMSVLGKVIEAFPESKAKFVTTGKSDLYAVRGERAIVLDHKSGRGDIEPAELNDQLRTNAVLVWKHHPDVLEVTVVLVQPLCGKPTVAVYDNAALNLASDWLDRTLKAEREATTEDRFAGDWCQYCPCETFCQTRREKAVSIVEPLQIETLPPDKRKEALFARCMEIDADTLIQMYEQRGVLAATLNSIEGALRLRLEQGDPAIADEYEFKAGRKTRSVTDAAAAYEALQPFGVELEDIWKAADLSLEPLETAIRIRSGKKLLKNGKESETHYNIGVDEARKTLTKALRDAGALEIKESQPQIVKRQQYEITDSTTKV